MKRTFSLALAAALLLSACSMPIGTRMTDEQIGTAAALTVQAARASEPAPLPTATLPPPATQPQSAAPETPAPQWTSTLPSGEARANFDDTVNCRTGPGINYERVFQTKPGDSFRIVGYLPPGFFVISTGAGDCWVTSQFVTPAGDLKAVPTVTLPPTPIGGTPDAPSFSKNGWQWFCYGSGQVEVELSWRDNADNEKGYRIYRNGELVAELSANSTYYKEVILYPGGQGLTYRVEAFNEIGAAGASTEVLFCDL